MHTCQELFGNYSVKHETARGSWRSGVYLVLKWGGPWQHLFDFSLEIIVQNIEQFCKTEGTGSEHFLPELLIKDHWWTSLNDFLSLGAVWASSWMLSLASSLVLHTRRAGHRLWQRSCSGLEEGGRCRAANTMARRSQARSRVGGRCRSKWAEGGWSHVGRCWAGRLHTDSIGQRDGRWWQGQWGYCSSLGDKTHSKTFCCEGRFSSTKLFSVSLLYRAVSGNTASVHQNVSLLLFV